MKRLIIIGAICFLLGTLIGATIVMAYDIEWVFNAVYDSTTQQLRIIGQ